MSGHHHLRSSGLGGAEDLVHDQVNRSRIEAILDLFNADEGRRAWVTQEGQEADEAERAGGEHPARDREGAFVEAEGDLAAEGFAHQRLEITGIRKDDLESFQEALEGVDATLLVVAEIAEILGQVAPVTRETCLPGRLGERRGRAHGARDHIEELPAIEPACPSEDGAVRSEHGIKPEIAVSHLVSHLEMLVLEADGIVVLAGDAGRGEDANLADVAPRGDLDGIGLFEVGEPWLFALAAVGTALPADMLEAAEREDRFVERIAGEVGEEAQRFEDAALARAVVADEDGEALRLQDACILHRLEVPDAERSDGALRRFHSTSPRATAR